MIHLAACLVLTICLVQRSEPLAVEPYRLELQSVGECEDLEEPLIDTDLYVVTDEDGKSRMSGYFTISTEIHGIKTKVSAAEWGNGGWQQQSIMYDVDDWCGSEVSKEFEKATNVTLGPDCLLPMGTFKLDDIDADLYLHAAVGDYLKTGRYLATVTVTDEKNEVVTCLLVDVKLYPDESQSPAELP
ncbi:uncharacterized protein [Anabrus simplex]|uniref:uncharacterized protein n=1 Tax=Anabrus simplex TaxID=316456 RepID=UPI0035A3AA4F